MLMTRFARRVVGANKWDKKWEKMNDDTPLSELCTVSDEAFVKVLLLNGWSMWIKINNKSDNKWRSDKRNGPKLEVEAKPRFSSKTSIVINHVLIDYNPTANLIQCDGLILVSNCTLF